MLNFIPNLHILLIFTIVVHSSLSFNLRDYVHLHNFESNELHGSWSGSSRAFAIQGKDAAWNYCDIKCTTFEKFVPGVDFYVATFGRGPLDPIVSECFGK